MKHATLGFLADRERAVADLLDLLEKGADPASLAATHHLRSGLIRALLMDTTRQTSAPASAVPRRILQYWNDQPPEDVAGFIESWRSVPGWTHDLFDDEAARDFILSVYGADAAAAYDYAAHPAFRSDLFRFMYLAEHGGFYIDADERRRPGCNLDAVASGDLVITPRCWIHSDPAVLGLKHNEVRPWLALERAYSTDHVTFYVNNSPLAARPGHPLLKRIVDVAVTAVLDARRLGERPRIHAATSPQIWTVTFARHLIEGVEDDRLAGFNLATQWLRTEAEEIWASYKATDRYWGYSLN